MSSFLSNVVETVAEAVSHKLHPMVEKYAQLFKNGVRTPVLKRPSDVGLDYEDTFFPSLDGIPLEAWFIPAESDKLLIVNHPMTCNRYGFPGHLPPWNTMFGGFEVNFLPELKHLHDAGYNILTYDLRNCGMSGEANIRALVLLNVVSGRTFIERGAEHLKLDPEKAAQRLDERLRELTGFGLDEETPRPYAEHVRVPTLMAQLRRDFLIHGERDGREIFDALGAEKKELLWIEESNQRFYAYNYFGQHPERLVAWFDQHMTSSARQPRAMTSAAH